MKRFFRSMASLGWRWARGIIGLAIIAWGYSYYVYPANIILMIIGTVIFLLAALNISLLAPLFGFPLSGNKIIRKYGEEIGVPGEEHTVQDS